MYLWYYLYSAGWLEPLLERIAESESNVVTPVIDVIDDETLRYQYSSAKATSVGGFDWNLQFNWHSIPDHEKKRRKHDYDPVRWGSKISHFLLRATAKQQV